jgi:hypothetical protein
MRLYIVHGTDKATHKAVADRFLQLAESRKSCGRTVAEAFTSMPSRYA